MQNVFLKYIQNGRIRSREDLRRLYRRLAIRTHPDHAGSDMYSQTFVAFGEQYEEAKRFLEQMLPLHAEEQAAVEEDVRKAFYKRLHFLERIDSPFNFRWRSDPKPIQRAREAAYVAFREWRKDLSELFSQAHSQYDRLKREKPLGPYRKDALYHNLYPIFHNIGAYHVHGNEFYRRQMRQNLPAVIERLEERRFFALRDYVLFLIEDTERDTPGGDSGHV